MGINYKTLKFLEKNIKKKKLSMATIGRQELHFPTSQIIHTVTFDGFQGFGLYQLSPEIFFNLYNKNNGFKNTKIYLIENLNNKFWYKINKKTKNKFNNFFSYGQLSIYVSTIKTKELVQINIKQKQKLAYKDSHNTLICNLKSNRAVLFCYLFLKKIFLSVFPSFFLNFDKKVVKEQI